MPAVKKAKPKKFKGTTKKKKEVSTKEEMFMEKAVEEIKRKEPEVPLSGEEISKLPQLEMSETPKETVETMPKELDQKINSVLSSYKQEASASPFLSPSLLKYVFVGIVVILVIGGGGYLFARMQKNNTEDSEETTSSERMINWDDFEANVEQKRLESDIEFEQLKETGGETTDSDDSSNGDTDTTDNSSTGDTEDLSTEEETVSNTNTYIESADDEELSYPVDFTLDPDIKEPVE